MTEPKPEPIDPEIVKELDDIKSAGATPIANPDPFDLESLRLNSSFLETKNSWKTEPTVARADYWS